MLQKIVHAALKHRHFWREVGFDELSELYVAVLLRGLSLSMSGIFVPFYMLRLDYRVHEIVLMMAWFFTFRMVADIASGYTTARIGPKHTMILGYMLQIASTASMISLPFIQWPLWMLGGLWGIATSFFFVPFQVGFSKVKHSAHSGKELGYVNIMERVGALIGPVVGGVVASVYGGQYTFVLATGVLLLGLVPLLKTKEPVRVHQKLDYKHFDVSKLKRQYVAFAALGVDNTISIIWWALFLGAFVFVNNAAYAQVGLIVSFSVGSAIIAARIIGRHIDAHRGRVMLRFFVGINSVVHLVRPFASSYFAAFSVNVLNDVISVGYRMPFLKGMYDSADDLPGYRIVFISSIESFASVVKAALWWCLAAATMVSASKYVFAGGFVVAAIASIVIRIENFSALAPRFDKKRIKS